MSAYFAPPATASRSNRSARRKSISPYALLPIRISAASSRLIAPWLRRVRRCPSMETWCPPVVLVDRVPARNSEHVAQVEPPAHEVRGSRLAEIDPLPHHASAQEKAGHHVPPRAESQVVREIVPGVRVLVGRADVAVPGVVPADALGGAGRDIRVHERPADPPDEEGGQRTVQDVVAHVE